MDWKFGNEDGLGVGQKLLLGVLALVFAGLFGRALVDANGPADAARIGELAVFLASTILLLVSHRLSSLLESVSSEQEGALMVGTGLLFVGLMALFGDGFDDELFFFLGLYCLIGVGQIVRPRISTATDE